MTSVAIIGAGLAGLTLARKLSQSARVEVFEKHYRAGGRMASREFDDALFDHGAQFFTVRNEGFKQFLQPMIEAGVVQDWQAYFAEMDGSQILKTRQWTSEFPHYVGVPSMSAIGEFLSTDLMIQTQTQVTGLSRENLGWRVHTDKGDSDTLFDWIVVTTPPQQASALLPESCSMRQALADTEMKPCYALMLTLQQAPELEFEAALIKNANISWITQNHTKPGRVIPSLLVHATNAWAASHLDEDMERVKSAMIDEVVAVTGLSPEMIKNADLKRWVYANIAKQEGAPYLLDRDRQLAACGDWCIKGRVESAYVSAYALSENIFDSGE